MNAKKPAIKAIFLIVIMITMSTGQSISNDRNFEENDRGEISKIDISYLNYLNEEPNLDYALSQTRNFAVLRIDFPDEAASRNRTDTIALFDEVESFFDEATYGCKPEF